MMMMTRVASHDEEEKPIRGGPKAKGRGKRRNQKKRDFVRRRVVLVTARPRNVLPFHIFSSLSPSSPTSEASGRCVSFCGRIGHAALPPAGTCAGGGKTNEAKHFAAKRNAGGKDAHSSSPYPSPASPLSPRYPACPLAPGACEPIHKRRCSRVRRMPRHGRPGEALRFPPFPSLLTTSQLKTRGNERAAHPLVHPSRIGAPC